MNDYKGIKLSNLDNYEVLIKDDRGNVIYTENKERWARKNYDSNNNIVLNTLSDGTKQIWECDDRGNVTYYNYNNGKQWGKFIYDESDKVISKEEYKQDEIL